MIIRAGRREEKENHESLGTGGIGLHLLYRGPVRGLDARPAAHRDGGGGGTARLLGRTPDYGGPLPAGGGPGPLIAGGSRGLAEPAAHPGCGGGPGGRDAGLDGSHDFKGRPPGPPGVGRR